MTEEEIDTLYRQITKEFAEVIPNENQRMCLSWILRDELRKKVIEIFMYQGKEGLLMGEIYENAKPFMKGKEYGDLLDAIELFSEKNILAINNGHSSVDSGVSYSNQEGKNNGVKENRYYITLDGIECFQYANILERFFIEPTLIKLNGSAKEQEANEFRILLSEAIQG